MFKGLARLLLRYRWPVLVVLGLTTAGSAILAPRIRFDFTPQAIFSGNDDVVAYCEAFEDTFGHDDAAVLVALEATGPRDVLDRRALTWQAEVAEAVGRLDRVQRVQAVAKLALPQFVPVPPWITSAPLIGARPVDEAAEVQVRVALDRFRVVEGGLVSADRRFSALVAFLDPAAQDVEAARQVVQAVQAVLADRPPPAGYAVSLSGLPVLRTDIVGNLRGDLAFLLPAAAGLFVAVLAVMFRRVSGTLLPLAAVAMGLSWTVGVLVLAHQSLNIISNVLPVLLFVIGMANCVHVVSRHAEEWELTPGDRIGASSRTVAHMGLACLLTSLTTAIGFASLLAARSDVLRALGWHAILGIGLLYVSTMTVLGTLLPLFRPARHCGSQSAIHPIARLVAASGHAVARHPRWTLAASAALIAASLWFARHVVINSYMIETYDEEHPTIRAMRLVENHLAGIVPLEVSLRAREPGQFLEPAVYRRVAEAEQFAAGRDPVLLARSYVDLYQEISAQLAGRDELRDDLPALDAAGAGRLRAADAVVRLIGPAINAGSFITDDGRQARILLRVRDAGTRRTLAFIDDLRARLAALFPPEGGVEARITGQAYIYATCMNRFVRDLLSSLFAASLIIFAVVAVLFRSFRLGLVSILPNVMPLIVLLGYLGLRGYEMNAANVVVFAISLGIAVDNTIHFLARFREEIKGDGDVRQAIRRSFHGTGRAIVMSSVLIVAGVSVLHLSRFVPSRRFAELISVSLGAALVGDLLLLPACLVLMWRRNREAGSPAPALSSSRGGRE